MGFADAADFADDLRNQAAVLADRPVFERVNSQVGDDRETSENQMEA